jgi:hypothetical protein
MQAGSRRDGRPWTALGEVVPREDAEDEPGGTRTLQCQVATVRVVSVQVCDGCRAG